MSGGKAGSTSQEIPKYLERASQNAIGQAASISKMGYAPYYGPAIAAVNPTERLAADNIVSGASAFGLAPSNHDVYAGMPDTVEMGGVSGYSSAPLFEQAVEELRTRAPEYMSEYDKLITPNGPNGASFYDPNNPEHVIAMVEERNRQSAPVGGSDWLNFYQIPSGGGFR